MIGKASLQFLMQQFSPLFAAREQIVLLQITNRGQSGGARDRMIRESLSVEKLTAAFTNRGDDLFARDHRRQRHVTASEAFAGEQDIRRHTII